MNKKGIEQEAINALLEKGINISIAGKRYHFSEVTLGMMDEITAIQFMMDEPVPKLTQATYASMIVSVMMEGPRMFSKTGFFDAFLKKLWRWKVRRRSVEVLETVKPSDLLNLAMTILKLCNTRGFMLSIGLMSASRTTSPKDPVEQQG